jgi:hypothetical protein
MLTKRRDNDQGASIISMFTVSPVNVSAFVGVIEKWPPPFAPMSSHQPGAPPAHQV